MAISSKLVISGGPISELDRRKRRRTSYNTSTATATATTTEVIELSLMGQNPLPTPVIDNKNESVQSPKNTKNQQDDTINTTNNITTTTTNNNSTLNNNTNNNTHNNTNSKTLTNSALKPTSTLPASTSTSTSTKTSISKTSIELSKYNIIHDPIYCMFKILLDTKGNTGKSIEALTHVHRKAYTLYLLYSCTLLSTHKVQEYCGILSHRKHIKNSLLLCNYF